MHQRLHSWKSYTAVISFLDFLPPPQLSSGRNRLRLTELDERIASVPEAWSLNHNVLLAFRCVSESSTHASAAQHSHYYSSSLIYSPSLFDLPSFHGNGSGGTGIGVFNVVVVVTHGSKKDRLNERSMMYESIKNEAKPVSTLAWLLNRVFCLSAWLVTMHGIAPLADVTTTTAGLQVPSVCLCLPLIIIGYEWYLKFQKKWNTNIAMWTIEINIVLRSIYVSF